MTRADNRGEGGILALLSLAFPENPNEEKKSNLSATMIAIGVIGAALLYGDGVITPAISVLSATEGLSVAAPWLEPFTVPLTLAILVVLFIFQRKGTESVAKLFGPVMLVWFVTLAITGILQIVRHPSVLAAINPLHAAHFLIAHGSGSFMIVGSVFLVATGAEALYADLGHFGRRPIALAWYWIVFPSLLLNYLGQGALALRDPSAHESPFFHIITCCAMRDFVIEEQKTSFFLGNETIITTRKPGMARWREHLFVAMSRHAQRPAQFFKLPVNRTYRTGTTRRDLD